MRRLQTLVQGHWYLRFDVAWPVGNFAAQGVLVEVARLALTHLHHC